MKRSGSFRKQWDLSRKNPEPLSTCTRFWKVGILFQASIFFPLTENNSIYLLGPMCELNVLLVEVPRTMFDPERENQYIDLLSTRCWVRRAKAEGTRTSESHM